MNSVFTEFILILWRNAVCGIVNVCKNPLYIQNIQLPKNADKQIASLQQNKRLLINL